jgi:hypothetical protein
MTGPTPDQMCVTTDTLRAEASVWDAQAGAMASIPTRLGPLSLTRVEAGIFQVVFGAYGEVLQQVLGRTSEGAQRMREVSATLHQVADAYDREEATVVQMMTHIY